MNAYVFPGQGSQFSGMGKDLYQNSATVKSLFDEANQILGFEITQIMFEGTEEQLKQTNVTQPAIFLHSVAIIKNLGDAFKPDMVAGHSLGEFSALVANQTLNFSRCLKISSQTCRCHAKSLRITT
jgi:[acyl-carrier-protein] S-malonyltransferase